jgi:integrase/recombinase XerD
VKGVKRPKVESYEGKTPALGDGQAQALLDAPGAETRSRGGAIGLSSRCCSTTDCGARSSPRSKCGTSTDGAGCCTCGCTAREGGKLRYLPLHPGMAELVTDYLEAAAHGAETAAALFRPVKNNTGGTMEGAVTADGIYKMVKHYAKRVGLTSSALARTHSGPRPRPMRWITRPISPRCRSGSGTPTSPPPGSTTGGRPVRRIADV